MLGSLELLLVLSIIALVGAIIVRVWYSDPDFSLEDYDYDYKKYHEALKEAKMYVKVSTIVIVGVSIIILVTLFYIFIYYRSEKAGKVKSQKDENMITCLNCGNIIPYKCSFCPKCGKAINNGAVPGYCEKCGTVLGKDSAFCRMCGNPIKK